MNQGRQEGFSGPQSLQLSEVLAWLEINQVNDLELRSEVVDKVLDMDQRWRAKIREKSNAHNGAGN